MNQKKKVAIIGAGAAGLMCACMVSQEHDVVVFEKNASAGKKLLLTGNGRCNLTNLVDVKEFLDSVPRNPEFLSKAVSNFSPKDIIAFFESIGIKTKVENNNRVFPYMAKAPAVKIALENHALGRGVQFLFESTVENIVKAGNNFELTVNGGKHIFDFVVIATGGMSFPTTGSTGDGYVFAEKLGHKTIPTRPSVCGVKLCNPTGLQGVSVECGIKLLDTKMKTIFKKDSGNLLFTKNGVSGPMIFEMVSRFAGESIDGFLLQIDFLQGTLIPRSVKNWVAKSTGKGSPDTLRFAIKDFESIEHATITRGGVDVNEVNPQTMESKLVQGLFFIGEVLDVDALSGGFNLQIAFSTATACASALG